MASSRRRKLAYPRSAQGDVPDWDGSALAAADLGAVFQGCPLRVGYYPGKDKTY